MMSFWPIFISVLFFAEKLSLHFCENPLFNIIFCFRFYFSMHLLRHEELLILYITSIIINNNNSLHDVYRDVYQLCKCVGELDLKKKHMKENNGISYQ